MAEVTVKQLAGVVGVPPEQLLQQMNDAGLTHADLDQSVSDSEKQQLLLFLKRGSQGASVSERKITLKRKSVSKIKVSGASGRKTVNVEVRKKRTYVKRTTVTEPPEEMLPAEPEEAATQNEAPVVDAAPSPNVIIAGQADKQEIVEPDALIDAASAAESASSAKKIKAKSKSAKTTPKLSTAAAKPNIAELALENAGDVRVEDDAKRKAEELARVEADKKAQAKTLEDAKRIAESLAQRSEDGEGASAEQDVTEEEDALVQQAFEESLAEEEKRQKRSSRKVLKNRVKVAKQLSEEHGFTQPTQPVVREVRIGEMISVPDLANQMSVKAIEVIKELMRLGVPAHVNQMLDQDTAVLVAEEMGHKYVLVNEDTLEDGLSQIIDSARSGNLEERAPVVTIMGHVDHGKTSLLDTIRKAQVAAGEAGGITQHIGAYHVATEKGNMTFLDTPGHAAFTAMRARGAKCTDVVILVVAADDGMMPQTAEAIDHARAAEVPIVVAVNKIDKPDADPDKVKNELSQQKQLIPEDWGGDTQFIEVSALTGQGIDELLDAVLLQAELLELKAPCEGPAEGVVIESSLDKGRGAVATLLVQRGSLNMSDMVLAGAYYGRIRAMKDEYGKALKTVKPSMPVEILGLNGVPEAGESFVVVANERRAREVAAERERKQRMHKLGRLQPAHLDNIFDQMGAADVATVNVVLKADVKGSLEALTASLLDLGNEEVKVSVIASGVGGITESDANLALTSGAVMIGFNVRADQAAKKICQEEDIDLRYYSVIYEVIEDVKAALSGLLQPERREKILGLADVKDVFRSSKFGAAAGCLVTEGVLSRKGRIRVLRDDVVVFDGELESLRRFKDDVPEVRSGLDCGVAVRGYNDVRAQDKIEAYEVTEIKRSL